MPSDSCDRETMLVTWGRPRISATMGPVPAASVSCAWRPIMMRSKPLSLAKAAIAWAAANESPPTTAGSSR
ncbi:hypothetical protein D3C72_2143090 [compost metagenome]